MEIIIFIAIMALLIDCKISEKENKKKLEAA